MFRNENPKSFQGPKASHKPQALEAHFVHWTPLRSVCKLQQNISWTPLTKNPGSATEMC